MNSRTRAAGAAALFLPLAAALALFSLMPVIRVSAHAAYDHSTPGDGEVVAAEPAKVDVYFKENIAKANGLPTLIVVNDSGDKVDAGSVLDDTDRTHISDALNPGLPDGRYTVIWHTVSADDGEEAQGSFHFYIGGAVTPVPTAAPGSATAVPSIPAVTPAPGSGNSDIPVWGLILGIVGGVVVGGAGGLLFGRRTGS